MPVQSLTALLAAISMSVIQQIVAMPFSLRQKRLAKERDPLGESDFVARIVDAGGDQEAARFVHEKLQGWLYAEGFTPYPEDDLERIYGIAEEELDEDLILDILKQIGLSPPSGERIKAFGNVSTPTDVARLVKAARAEN